MARKKYKEREMESGPEGQKRCLSSQESVENSPKGAVRYRNFDEFWFMIKKERNLEDKWKMPLLAHFKSAGFNSPEKYEAGLRHFGL